MFAPPTVQTEVFTRLPDAWRRTNETPWTLNRGGGPLHSFLEGPSFDREGRLYCVDIPHGRIFRISPAGEWEVFAEYDGQPNGLKIHRDGRIFVADHARGLLVFDPRSGARTTMAAGTRDGAFLGLNDLAFADDGTLYFTDPGESGLDNPDGRIFRWREGGEPELVYDGLPYPNGLVVAPAGDMLYVGVSRSLQVLRLPLRDGRVYKSGVFLQLSGGLGGPDGMAMDDRGGLAVVHAGFGTVWHFDRLGEPTARIRSCAGIRTTNVAYGGPDLCTLYITEAEHGVILRARLPTAGRPLFSHR